ncbi:MAG: DUF86 domain-containing protein [Gammaproteobacteria bacterium]|nr:DUF86 domain-containing protein [Gammaproteobacteria bacterium]
MHRDPRVLLADIDRAGADIERFTRDIDSDAYAENAMVQAAVERKFEVVGEALNRLHQDHPELAARIPGLRKVVDFRNLLAHSYDRVVTELVWDYAKSNLPQLRRSVQDLLVELDPPEE